MTTYLAPREKTVYGNGVGLKVRIVPTLVPRGDNTLPVAPGKVVDSICAVVLLTVFDSGISMGADGIEKAAETVQNFLRNYDHSDKALSVVRGFLYSTVSG